MPLRPLIVDHFWLKLLSLVLASLIWLTVRANLGSSGDDTKRTFAKLPIMLLTDSGEHVAMAANPDVATVIVRGPALLIEDLTDQDIHVYVRLQERAQSAGEMPIHAHVPSGAKVALVTPATTSVKPYVTP